MKGLFTTILLSGFVSVGGLALAGSNLSPAEIPAPVDRLFVPHGFDDNDVSEVVIHGEFPDACYRIGNSGFELDQANMVVTVWASALEYRGEICAQVMSPYIVPVKLGVLEEGTYQIKVRDVPNVTASLTINKRTTESPDDFLYAPVEGADIKKDAAGRQSLTLMGSYPYTFWGCLKIKEVRMVDKDDVLVIQPIMEHLDGEACENYKHSFDETFGLSAPLEGESLLHVRVLNGNSYNRFVSLN